MSTNGSRPVVPPIASAIDDRFVTPTEEGQPTAGVVDSKTTDQPLPESFDVRKPDIPMESLKPYGSSFGVDVTEILRRGFKQLSADEQANVIGAYLATQRQQLSIFETADQIQDKQRRAAMDVDNHRFKKIITVVMIAAILLTVAGVLGLIVYYASKGVLSDSSLLNGLFTLLQEVFRVITSGGKY